MGILMSAGGAMGGTSSMVVTAVYIVAIIAFLYFIMIRPQKKEQTRLKDMLSSLEVGDTICTTGGFYGIIIDIPDESTVVVEFGNKNCRISMKKEAIAQVEKPEEPAETDSSKKK